MRTRTPLRHLAASRSAPFALFLSLLGSVAGSGDCLGLTIEVATGAIDFIESGDAWRFFRGRESPSNPPGAWRELAFADSSWETGPSGFGYGDGDDATVLADMEDSYVTVYIRRQLTLESVPPNTALELVIDYDDGFVAYLNGREVASRGMPDDEVIDHETTATSHEAGDPERIPLGDAESLLQVGVNILAIEGHNVSAESGDFSLIPALRTVPGIVRDGNTWIVDTEEVLLQGTVAAGSAVSVRIENGTDVLFDPGSDTWSGKVSLAPGRNAILVEALDAGASVVESGTIDIVYVPPSNRAGGALAADTVWSGAVLVDETVTVPPGVLLTVEPGTVILMKSNVSLVVSGRLVASGTGSEPVRFTRHGEGTRWKQILFVKAADSRLSHCVIEYADSEGAHQDYYEPGLRSYHEAVVVLASRLDVEETVFQKLPDESAGAEGDAIAVISDDPEEPGEATADIRGCSFLSIGQGVHSRYAAVVVEDCYFAGKRGDNDDVDLWGESTPPPLIRNNLFGLPNHEDRINPTRCSAIIVGNTLLGSDDHGIVLRDKGSPVVMNNLILGCANGGIAVENSCTALLVNNTIVDCGRGLRLFDLGRWGPPYNLSPGGGTATVVNCIIWDCDDPVTLEDSSNTDIPDRGSHITVLHSDIETGRAGVSVSGAQSTVTWGEGNIDLDPLFEDGGAGDYRLKVDSPAVDAGTAQDAPPTDIDGNPRVCGAAADMGAHERCDGTIPTSFRRGDTNGDSGEDIADAIVLLFYLFAGGREPSCLKSADVDDDGAVAITDVLGILGYLFMGEEGPPAPFVECGQDTTPDELTCEAFLPCG